MHFTSNIGPQLKPSGFKDEIGSFATSGFGALASLFLVLASLCSYIGSAQVSALPNDGLSPANVFFINLIPKYFELMDKCNHDDDAVRIILAPTLRWLTFSNTEESLGRRLA